MTVLRHVIDSISPASTVQAEAARVAVAGAGVPMLERLAERLGGAQHTSKPRAHKRMIVVVCGDHGVGDPGIALGASHPTAIAAHAIADGSAALCQVARASHAPIVLVDAGAREAMPASAIALGRGPTKNLMSEPAMTVVDASLALEAGIALAVSLVDQGLDVVAIGALGIGAEVSAAALLGASIGGGAGGATGRASGGGASSGAVGGGATGAAIGGGGASSGAIGGGATAALTRGPALDDAVAESAWVKGAAMRDASALELLAAFGGPETGVLAGFMLGCASMNVPVIIDSYATGAAALVAAALAPNVVGYLIAAHTGTFTHRHVLAHLGLTPTFDVGLGHGEGTGAAMAIPLVDQVAAIAQGS